MNIFFLHMIPSICAIYHLDKHVVKMILETAQLLCSAHHLSDSNFEPPYKLTHKNHPCAIWTRTSLDNYKWLVELGKELCKEYTYRYGKIHKCQTVIEQLDNNLPPIPEIGFTTPALAMPNEYKGDDAVESYRAYYLFEKSHILFWKKRDTPHWVLENKEMFEEQ